MLRTFFSTYASFKGGVNHEQIAAPCLPSQPAPAVVFDLLDLPAYLPPSLSVIQPSRNFLEESFNEIDIVADSFGDEINVNPDLPLITPTHAPSSWCTLSELVATFSSPTPGVQKSSSLN